MVMYTGDGGGGGGGGGAGAVQLWYMTTGYLQQLMVHRRAGDFFSRVTHLCVDEAHERSVETDVVCLFARRLLSRHRRLRLVLMSATLDAGLFRGYLDEVGRV